VAVLGKNNKVELSIVWHDYEAEFASLTSALARAVAENQEKMWQMNVRCGATTTKEGERVVGGLSQRYEEMMQEIQTTREGFAEEGLQDHLRRAAARREVENAQSGEPTKSTPNSGRSRSRLLPH
jgi:hypothetical protein